MKTSDKIGEDIYIKSLTSFIFQHPELAPFLVYNFPENVGNLEHLKTQWKGRLGSLPCFYKVAASISF